jgi:tRNA G18 (ribose-2'-O)-methylase SpoU
MIVISDVSDQRLNDYRSLKDVTLRRKLEPEGGLYIAESANVLRQAISAGHVPRSILIATDRVADVGDVLKGLEPSVPVLTADYDVLRQVTGFHVHRGVLASMHRPAPLDWRSIAAAHDRIVIIEDVVDHTNLGAVFRSAAALGWGAVLLTPRAADPLYRRSVRVSMGGVFQIPWARLDHWPRDLTGVRELGFTCAALTPHIDAVDLRTFQPPQRLALLLGTEGEGLSGEALVASDLHLSITMAAGMDSLNIGAAAAIAMWALSPA